MDFTISPVQDQILEFGNRLREKFDRAYWLDRVDTRTFPFELWGALGESGHLGILVPESEGGAGLGLMEMSLFTEGLARAGFPLLTLITGPGLALPALARHGSKRQRDEILPDLLAGRTMMPFAITEAAVGSNIFALQASARPDGDRLILSGTKNFTSGADVASHVLVLARTHDPAQPESGRAGYTLVVVPTDAAGLSIVVDDTLVPMPEKQCSLTFNDVILDRDDIVGAPGQALAVLAPALVNERVVAAALSCGIGQYVLDRAVFHASHRSVFGRPLAAHQAVQHPLSKARIRIELATLMIRNAAWLADTGAPALGEANMASWAAGEAGFEAANAALQAHGGQGYTREADVYSMQQLARLLQSAPVHAESALNAVGEQIMGLPRSY